MVLIVVDWSVTDTSANGTDSDRLVHVLTAVQMVLIVVDWSITDTSANGTDSDRLVQ